MSDKGQCVVAVVVTRDRQDLLRECLLALRAQDRAADQVIIVDNASSDGTRSMVRAEFPEATLIALNTNLGGAGGFQAGLRHAHPAGADWIWLLDDDTAARPDCLARLLKVADDPGGLPAPALLASRVEWTDGRPHPMNRPILRTDDIARSVACAELGLAPLRTATFVSLLVARSTIDRHGYPFAGYFLWADDIEYTARVLRTDPGYLVPCSVAVHRTQAPRGAAADAGERFYYHVRNNLFMMRGAAWSTTEKPGLVWSLGGSILAYLQETRWRWPSVRIVVRGLLHGLGPLPDT